MMNNQPTTNVSRKKSIDIIQKTDLSTSTILDLPIDSNKDNFLTNELTHSSISSNEIDQLSTNDNFIESSQLESTSKQTITNSNLLPEIDLSSNLISQQSKISSPATIDSINIVQSLNNSHSTAIDLNRNYYSCGHCEFRFILNELNSKLVICPSCKLISSIDEDFKNTNGILYLLFFSILLLMTDNLVHLVVSKNRSTFFYYLLKTIFYLSSIACLWRSIYYFTIKISPRSL